MALKIISTCSLAFAGTAFLSLLGCDKGMPTDQVVASIAGEDVTRRDLSAELQAGGAPNRSDAEMRGPVLQQIIDRKLLARIARREGLDHTPDYLAAIRRGRDIELAQILSDQIEQSLPAPTSGDIDSYLRDHPKSDRAGAAIALQHDRFGKTLAQTIEKERESVPIRYQTSFGPAAE